MFRNGKPQPFTAAAIAVVALLAVLVLITSFAKVETASVTLPQAQAEQTVAPDAGAGEEVTRVEVTRDTVRYALETLTRCPSYSRQVTVTRYWADGSAADALTVQVKGSSAHILQNSQRHILLLEDSLWIWYEGSTAAYQGSLADEDAAQLLDGWQGVLTWETLLTEDAQILDAGYVRWEGRTCLWASYTRAEDQRCTLYVDVDTGLVVQAEITEDGTPIYTMTAGEAELSTPADEVFTPPQ